MRSSKKSHSASKKPEGSKSTQTWNLQQKPGGEEWRSSVEWLQKRSLEVSCLTLPHLLSLSQKDDGIDVQQESLTDFETRLYQMIETYHSRIKCLNQGSRRVFGMVKGSRLGVVIDSSDITCCEERLSDLKQDLMLLLEEQLCRKKQLYVLSFGSEVTRLWDCPREVTPLRLRELQEWILQLRPAGGCNLRRALETTCRHTQLDSLVIVLGSRCSKLWNDLPLEIRLASSLPVFKSQLKTHLFTLAFDTFPDQDAGDVLSLMVHIVQEMSICVHTVAYNNYSPAALETVKNVAKVTGGRYHLFSSALGVVDSSSDLEPLWAEIKSARHLLHYIQDMRQKQLRDSTPSVHSELSRGLENLSLSDLDPEPPERSVGLNVQPPGHLPVTSEEWLKTNGLKAKKLSLYQVLAPNVYSPLEGFVPVLGKRVHSTVHEKAMVQLEWHDGTMRNVHVDLPLLQSYQKRLVDAERVMEDRVLWLTAAGSRQIWGAVCEQEVQVLLDMSAFSVHYQLHIQHAVRLLLEEQLPNTHSFSITAFGSEVQTWRAKMAPPTRENLQDAWRWVQALNCGGERDTLAVLRHAVETGVQGEEALTRGLYLFTTGVPDHDSSALTVSAYASEVCGDGLRLHVCLFTRENEVPGCPPRHRVTRPDTALALRTLAHAGAGRFHWITDTGLVESDDVIALIAEMEKGAYYWQKCCELVESLVQRSSSGNAEDEASFLESSSSPIVLPQPGQRRHKLPPPRPTQLSLARMGYKEEKRSATWRPSSAKAVIPPALRRSSGQLTWAVLGDGILLMSTPSAPLDGLDLVRPVKSSAKQKSIKTSHSVFYLENGNTGAVLKTSLKPKSVRKIINTVKLPKREDICSTKQWMKQFGIRSLKLDLHKLVSGPSCTHRKQTVPTVGRSVSAKYCAIFPSVELNGCVRHLFLSAGEMRLYLVETERLLQRYVQRMKWLLSGSRRVFGCVLEQAVCVLLDVSGSMAPCLPELQRELAALIWEQLHTARVRMNIVAFSGEVCVWQSELVEASEEKCREAETWLGQLSTHGNTSILHALQVGSLFGDSVGLYLVSDGRSDCSFSMMLREAERLTTERHVTIHTITLQHHDREVVEFLKSLAHKTGGRFHQTPSHTDTESANQILSRGLSEGEASALPDFDGDDLKRLKEEIEKLRMFRKQAKAFREILLKKNEDAV